MDSIHISQSFPIWIAIIILVISFAIVIFSYYRTDKPLNRRYRYALIALRILAIGLILFCLLDPTIIMREETIKKSNILVLIDDSQSMSLTDSGEKTARIDDVKKAILVPPSNGRTDLVPLSNGRTDTSKDGFKSIIESLDEHFNTQLYQFSSEVTPVKELSLKAQGNLTDIGKAITKTFDDWKGQPVAGIVLITDGSHNSGEDPVRSAQKTGVPIYTVGVGQAKIPRDISVSRVEVSPVAYVDHALPIRVAISSNGYDGREVRIKLNQSDNFGSLKDSASLKLDSRLNEQIVDLQTKPQQEGTIKFTVSVSSAPDELTQQNNTYTFFVKVVKTKLKVLYVEGSPRWESTFLNRTLQRDPNIDVTYLITTKQGGYYPQFPPKTFPDTRNELSSYDVIILGDISPSFFKNEQFGMIKDFIENRGGSILFLGGLKSYGDGGFGESMLRDMLPIDIGQNGANLVPPSNGRTEQIKTPFNPVLTQQGMTHPITRLSDDPQENTAIWRDLPPINRFYSGIGIKSGATVLAENQQEKRPFITFQRYGKGMVLMIAGDDLWQWAFGAYPFGGDDSYYRKFWSGTIRWLASVRTQADQVSVTTGKQTYSRDEKVLVKAYVYNENYDPVNDAQIKAQVLIPSKTTRDLIFTLEENGRYSAEFSPTMDGNYKINVEALRNGNLIGKSSTEFIVQTATLEFLNTQLNEPLLKEIADISGGAYYKINDISNLPSSIKETKDKVISIRERSIWDNAFVLIIVMALLTTEWLIRKRKGLV